MMVGINASFIAEIGEPPFVLTIESAATFISRRCGPLVPTAILRIKAQAMTPISAFLARLERR